MASPVKTAERFQKLSRICLALPQVIREDMGTHSAFRVDKKVFVYYLRDHHGDRRIGLCCKALPGDNARLIAAHPQKFYLPAYVGPRGWVALRLDRSTVDWNEVRDLIQGSYELTAPRRLLDRLKGI